MIAAKREEDAAALQGLVDGATEAYEGATANVERLENLVRDL